MKTPLEDKKQKCIKIWLLRVTIDMITYVKDGENANLIYLAILIRCCRLLTAIKEKEQPLLYCQFSLYIRKLIEELLLFTCYDGSWWILNSL